MSKSQTELSELLKKLITQGEHEVVEFKHATTNYDLDKLGEYTSALANEANLRAVPQAWLVFGISDSANVVGTQFRALPKQLESLKHEIAQNTSIAHGIRDIHEFRHHDGRVLFCEIAPAPPGIPIAWKGKYCARDGESLTELSISKLDEIRRQNAGDWTAEVVEEASLDDLDDDAIAAARRAVQERNPRITDEVIASWEVLELLDTIGLLYQGRLTRTALLLLGKPSAARHFGAVMPEVTWILSDEERVYEHFTLPFLTVGNRVYERVRNYQVRLLQPDVLVQTEIQKYDRQSLLEAIHNCIAHMNYRDGARVVVEEYADKIVLENTGEFYDGSPEEYLLGKRRAHRYRNPTLVQAMTRLNMIDHIGYGIQRIGRSQAMRFLPLPDYSLTPESVQLTIYGAQIDVKYSELLMQKTDLPLADIFALDRVQKGLSLPDDVVKRLRQARLIEGRKPRLHISAAVATATGTQSEYMRLREIEDEHYLALLIDYIEKFGPVKRADLDDFIWRKMHESMTDEQKGYKVKNLLQKLKHRGQIEVIGRKRGARWQITK